MGLEGIDVTKPNGQEFLKDGDNEIRLLKSMLKAFAELSHYLGGEHKFGIGPVADRPAPGKKGNFWLLTAAGVATELQYDDGAAWQYLTKNQDIIDFMLRLPTHQAASPIDHPDKSVTRAKLADNAVGPDQIEKGKILKKHLDGSESVASIANLVNGGAADALHYHAQVTPLNLVASGSQVFSYTTLGSGPVSNAISLNLGTAVANTPKRYIVSARVKGETGSHVGSDDGAFWNIELGTAIKSKDNYSAPQSGGGIFGRYAHYEAVITLSGDYTLWYSGGAGPTYINFTVEYEVYEVV